MVETKKSEILLESGTNELEVMEFTIANRHFGINVAKIIEIAKYSAYPVTPMPNSNPFVEGVFKHRDGIMTVINLASYMGLPPSEDEVRDIIIITNFNKVNSAFHVHDVNAIHRISWTDIEKPDKAIYGGEEGLATGIAHCGDRLITIVDFEKILTDISPGSGIQITDINRLGHRAKTMRPVLIAEDSQLLERMIIESLEKAGYMNVICCANGREAWEKLTEFKTTGNPIEEHVGLIITDIEMPQMDGHRLLKLIRDDPVLMVLPVIMFSSLISDEMRVKGVQLGATEQLSKPEISRLIVMVDKHIL